MISHEVIQDILELLRLPNKLDPMGRARTMQHVNAAKSKINDILDIISTWRDVD